MRLFCLSALLCSLAYAQHGSGYLVGGFTGVSNSIYTYWHGTMGTVAFGGETGLGTHFTVGGEAGALLAAQNLQRSSGLLSLNAAFYPRQGAPKVDPFVTAGGSLLVRTSVQGLWNFGGGTNVWLTPRVGVRIEFRDHVWPAEGTALHFTGIRFGIAFRPR